MQNTPKSWSHQNFSWKQINTGSFGGNPLQSTAFKGDSRPAVNGRDGFSNSQIMQGGPLPALSGAITPTNGLKERGSLGL